MSYIDLFKDLINKLPSSLTYKFEGPLNSSLTLPSKYALSTLGAAEVDNLYEFIWFMINLINSKPSDVY
ncbi:hypothetical protein GCM10023339_35230 [Alloalcanivorax gelatiniphagus]